MVGISKASKNCFWRVEQKTTTTTTDSNFLIHRWQKHFSLCDQPFDFRIITKSSGLNAINAFFLTKFLTSERSCIVDAKNSSTALKWGSPTYFTFCLKMAFWRHKNINAIVAFPVVSHKLAVIKALKLALLSGILT